MMEKRGMVLNGEGGDNRNVETNRRNGGIITMHKVAGTKHGY
jgi:hypothetical protein